MNELEYLRREISQISNKYSTQIQNTFRNVLFMWGGVVVLLTSQYYKNFTGNALLCFIMVSIFFISVLTLYVLTEKNKKHAKDILKIAMYITAFYEESPKSKKANDEKEENKEKSFWEYTLFEKDYEDKDQKMSCPLKNQYFMFSLIAVIMEIVFFSVIIDYSYKNCDFDLLLILPCFAELLLSIYLLYKIRDNSMVWSPNRAFEEKKKHLNYFIEYAISKEYYSREEAFERFGDDFLSRVGVSKT